MKHLTLTLILCAAALPVWAGDASKELTRVTQLPHWECTTIKPYGWRCIATVTVPPLSMAFVTPRGKVCWLRDIIRSKSPIGTVVQDHGCGAVGIYNPTLKEHVGAVTVIMTPTAFR